MLEYFKQILSDEKSIEVLVKSRHVQHNIKLHALPGGKMADLLKVYGCELTNPFGYATPSSSIEEYFSVLDTLGESYQKITFLCDGLFMPDSLWNVIEKITPPTHVRITRLDVDAGDWISDENFKMFSFSCANSVCSVYGKHEIEPKLFERGIFFQFRRKGLLELVKGME